MQLEMASTSNPLEEILNSDVADSPFSALVRPISTSISPTTGRDAITNVLQTPDRSNHMYGSSVTSMTVGQQQNSNGGDTRSSYTALSSSALQGAVLQNHSLPVDGSGQTGKVFNNGVTTSQFAVPQSGTSVARGPVNVQIKTEPDVSGRNAAGQTVVVTVANPTAASLAQSLENFLNANKFNQQSTTLANIAASGLSNVNAGQKPISEQKPLVTNVGNNLVVQTHGSTIPAQVMSQLQPQHVTSVVSMAQVVKTEITHAATSIKPFTVTGQQNLTTGQQALTAGQQNLTVIQSTPQQGTIGFPSQHVQIVNMPTQNVQRTSVAPVPGLRTLAPRIAINQPVRIQQPVTQNLPVIRPQGVMAGQISFGPGVQPNLPPGNVFLLKNDRGQVVVLQNPQTQASAANSPVIQSVQPSSANVRPPVAGQIGLVQSGLTGPGLIAVSSAQAQYIQPQMTATVRIPSSSQGIIHMQQPTSSMATQQPNLTTLHSTALSTPSIVSRLVQPSNIAQMTATSQTSTSAGATVAANQKDIQENVRKCKNFLSTLMKLASSQPENVVINVKKLIQGLIDGNVEPEDFTYQLQKELKSSPQPYLVPFLRKSLPFLRQSLYQNKMTIDGIRPPPASVANNIGVQLTMATPSVPAFSGATSIANVRQRAVIPNSVMAKPSVPTPQVTTQQQQQLRLAMMQQMNSMRMAGAQQKQQQPTLMTAEQTKNLLTRPALLSMQSSIAGTQPSATVVGANATSNGLLPQMNVGASATHKGEKRKYEAMRDDDDINDVATMGGVNLTEESRNILATNSELVSGQLRSCKDEKFLETPVLVQRVNGLVQRRGLDGSSPEVANALSHAVQDHLRTIIEQLSLYVSHRLENYRTDPRFEQANDRRVQLKFLEELGSIERKRHEEAERGVLMRAAKSRAKAEDPEQAKLKERAKAYQQQEMEELRQREANQTALAAIGPRKPRTTLDATGSADSGSSMNKTIVPMKPRVKRANLRDLLFLLEQRRETRRSAMLYKAFLK